MAAPFRVGFVAGVTPDKWSRTWAERMPRQPLTMVPLGERDGVALLRSGDLEMCFVRLPVDQEGLHLVPLYDEQPVVVVAQDHPVAAYDRIDVTELADEHLLQDPDEVPEWRDLATEVADGTRHPVPPMSLRQAVESVAADAGILIVAMSVARLHHRKDVKHVPVTGVPTTRIGLAWLRDVDDERFETFVGVVRGRRAGSSRGPGVATPEPPAKAARPTPKGPASGGARRRGPGRPRGRGGRHRP